MADEFVAEFEIQQPRTIEATFEVATVGGGTKDHDKLNNRDLSDQHPISAITGLEEELYSKVDKNSPITGATKAKITYDEKGLVTGGQDLVASDIPDLSSSYIPTTEKATANGVASLDNDGLVPASQLPSATSSVKGAVIVDEALNSNSNNPVRNKTITNVIDRKQDTITGGATSILVDNLTTDKALISNNSGKVAVSSVTSTELGYVSGVKANIQDQLDNLKSRGRFLSLWNCTTGLAQTTPTSLPYEYKTGDYFIVGVVGTTNYKPNGDEYTGTASTTVESGTVAVNDTYYYDGTNWVLQVNAERDVSFSSIVGQPTDNANLATALGNKYDASNPSGYITKSGISADSPIAYNSSTGKISVETGYQIPTTSQVTQIGTNTTNIALKANIASPAFTGTPTAPTATAGTDTTQIATTAFVQDAVESVSYVLQIREW